MGYPVYGVWASNRPTLAASFRNRYSWSDNTMACIYWDRKASQAKESAAAIKAEMKSANQQIDKLVDRIVNLTNENAVGAIENKIGQLEQRKLVLAEQASNLAVPPPPFGESLELSLRFLANPYNIWASGVFELKRLVFRLVFSEPLQYDREGGYRNP